MFGISLFSRACETEKDIDSICEAASQYLAPQLDGCQSFKVEAKRSDKTFPLNSPAICNELGGYLLEKFPHLHVDVHNPDLIVIVEVRDFGAYEMCIRDRIAVFERSVSYCQFGYSELLVISIILII